MKRERTGIFINILMLIIAILIAILFFLHYIKENEMPTGFLTREANTVISSISLEKNEITESIDIQNKAEKSLPNTQIPILEEKINANSKINDSNTLTNAYKYYYYQLDDNEKEIYNTIEANIENIKEGTYVIQIPDEVGKILDEENGEKKLNEEFQSAWDAIIMDRVDLFFIDVSKVTLEMRTTTYGKTKIHKLSIKPNSSTYLYNDFYNKEIIDTAQNQLKNIKEQYINQLSGSNYEKILKLNDLLIENLQYGAEYENNAYNIYGALIQRQCVCEGYAEAFKYIMDDLQIPCIIVIGTAKNSEGNSENHEWNYVMLDNKWYAVDVTWNDPIILGGGLINNSLKHKYLLNGTSINENHFPDGKISGNGKTFYYPELNNNDYK